MADSYDDLQQSYGRCLRGKNFIERFYEIFLASHPDIAPMFAATDFQKQRMALRRGHQRGDLACGRQFADQAHDRSNGHHAFPRRPCAGAARALPLLGGQSRPGRQRNGSRGHAGIDRALGQGMGAVVGTFIAQY